MALAGLAGFLLLAGLVDVAPQVRVHAFADAQTRIVEDPALFEGNVRARHVGHRLSFCVGDEAAHPHGFVGAAFDLPIFVLAQARGSLHVTEPVMVPAGGATRSCIVVFVVLFFLWRCSLVRL